MNLATEIPQAVPAYSRNSSLSHKYDKYSYFRRVGSTFFAPESGPSALGVSLAYCCHHVSYLLELTHGSARAAPLIVL